MYILREKQSKNLVVSVGVGAVSGSVETHLLKSEMNKWSNRYSTYKIWDLLDFDQQSNVDPRTN